MSGKAAAPCGWRLAALPRLMGECGAQAAAYGQCVLGGAVGQSELRMGACAKEFEELKQCISKVAKKSVR